MTGVQKCALPIFHILLLSILCEINLGKILGLMGLGRECRLDVGWCLGSVSLRVSGLGMGVYPIL